FFFQAEDGIRDLIVTGVQTCALPIFAMPRYAPLIAPVLMTPTRTRSGIEQTPYENHSPSTAGRSVMAGMVMSGFCEALFGSCTRSEERRVGKECRSGSEQYE